MYIYICIYMYIYISLYITFTVHLSLFGTGKAAGEAELSTGRRVACRLPLFSFIFQSYS